MEVKILSVFIDESGNFGAYDIHSPFYMVTMVLHDQSTNLSKDFSAFDQQLENNQIPPHAIHSGPLIRRESFYRNDTRVERRQVFGALFNFARKLNIKYTCVKLTKDKNDDSLQFNVKLSRAIANTIREKIEFWNSFDRIIVYYDNGQVELTRILTSVFSILFSNVEFRKVKPIDYKLFQIADMICTLALLATKAELKIFTKSELDFFGSIRDFKRNYLKSILKKHL